MANNRAVFLQSTAELGDLSKLAWCFRVFIQKPPSGLLTSQQLCISVFKKIRDKG